MHPIISKSRSIFKKIVTLPTRIMRIYFGLILEVEAEIYATLERIATLGEVFLVACSGIIYREGIVMGIRQITSPETDEDLA